MSFRQILKEKEFWLLSCLGLLIFPGAFLFGDTFFYRDIYLNALPVKKLYGQILRSGQLPLWHPYLNGGQPLLAEINFSVFYPSNLLYLIFPLYTAFNLNTIGHVMLGAAGAYCLARFMGLSVLSSLLCGIIFSCCGYSLSLSNFPKGSLAHAYIPWLTLIWHRFLLEKNFRWFFLCVLLGLFQIFAGVPEWTLIIFSSMLVWSIAYPYQLSTSRRIVGLILLGIMIILCSAIQLIPSLEMVAVSSRAQQTSFDSFAVWSIHFERLPEMILPGFLGSVDTLSSADYWGSKIEDQFFPYILSIYFGIGILLLSLSGLRNNDKNLQKFRYSIAVLSVVALLFSLGRYFPLTYFVYNWIPGIDHFRYPVKFLCISILPISLLAAFGFESECCSNSKPGRKFVIFLWSIVIALSLLFWLVLVNQSFLSNFAEVFFKRPASDVMRSGIARSILHCLVILILLTLIFTVRRVRQSQWNKLAVLIVITLDLLIAGRGLNPLAPVSFYQETPDVVNLVRKELSGGKFYRTANPTNVVLRAPSNDILWQYRWNLEVLNDYLATTYEIPTIFHGAIDGLEQKRLTDLTNAISNIPWSERLPLLSAAGVTVIMTHEKLSLPGVELRYILRNQSNIIFYIYKNKETVIPASRVLQIAYRKNFKDSFEALTDKSFLPKNAAITDEELRSIECNDSGASVRLLRQSLLEMEYETGGACEGYLVLTLPYYKDWKVTIDGKSDRLLRMNWAFSGVKVPAGNHRVSLHYSTQSLKIGALISFASLFLIGGFSVRTKSIL
jgi:hypothetical protein